MGLLCKRNLKFISYKSWLRRRLRAIKNENVCSHEISKGFLKSLVHVLTNPLHYSSIFFIGKSHLGLVNAAARRHWMQPFGKRNNNRFISSSSFSFIPFFIFLFFFFCAFHLSWMRSKAFVCEMSSHAHTHTEYISLSIRLTSIYYLIAAIWFELLLLLSFFRLFLTGL